MLSDIKEDNNTETAKIMKLCVENLKNSASIINRILHNTFSDEDSFTLEEESKRTRRNSQYKTSAIYMIYYLIYSVYYKKKPENVNFVLSNKTANIIHYETPEGVKKSGPIQHYNSFKNYTYTYQMVQVVDANMSKFINFGIDEFFKYCGQFLAISLVIKRQEKKTSTRKRQSNNFESYNKKRKTTNTTSVSTSYEFDSIDMSEDEYDLETSHTEVIELMAPYINMSILNLREEAKRPSVLMKFYQAWLMECDWELVFKILGERIRNNQCPTAQLRRLLQYTISVICKHITAPSQRALYIEKLVKMLKNQRQQGIVTELCNRAMKFKYSQYDVPTVENSEHSDDTHVYDIKTFQMFARYTHVMHYHFTPVPINLEDCSSQRTVNGITRSIKILKYVLMNKHYLFDVIQTTGIDDDRLRHMSWMERLSLAQKPFLQGEPEYNVIRLLPITYRQIQFENFPCGPNVYAYLRTGGLGIGTIFQRLKIPSKDSYGKTNIRLRNNTRHQTARRFTRVTVEDLLVSPNNEIKATEPKEEAVAPPMEANYNLYNSMIPPQVPYYNLLRAAIQQQQTESFANHLMNPYISPPAFDTTSYYNQLLLKQQPAAFPPICPQPVRTPSPVPPPPTSDFLSKYMAVDPVIHHGNLISAYDSDELFQDAI